MTATHAFLPPSGASSWSKCAMWPTMNARFPQEFDSSAASEGTAAHWAAWEVLANRPITPGTQAPNGTTITDEMLDGADLLADTVRARMLLVDGDWRIEQPIRISAINAETFGTPDYWGFKPSNCHLEIVDFKFGFRFVDEFFNPQGLCYLLGILEKIYGDYATAPPNLTVSFTIVQPRCYYRGAPVRTHSFYLSDARNHSQHLRNMAEAATLKEPTATTNEHCGDCPGRHACSALQLAAYADAEYSNARTPLELSPFAAALELRFLMRALDRLEARVEGLKETTLANLRAGKQVPYFRAEAGYGRTLWKIPDSQVVSIGQLFGKDLSKPGTITPTQAIKLGIDESVIKAYSFTPTTTMKLVRENSTDAPKVFGRQQQEI